MRNGETAKRRPAKALAGSHESEADMGMFDAPAFYFDETAHEPARRVYPESGQRGLLAAIVGDVVGSVYEFRNIKTEDFPLLSDGSTFTDDTVMTLAVADGLMAALGHGVPITTALVDSMQALGRAYPDAGYGGNFAHWLDSRDPQPYGSWGNGSAMRVSPVAWACDSLEAVELVAAETAKVTHNHFEGIRGAQAVAGCIFLARRGEGDGVIRRYASERFGYALDFTLDEIRDSYAFDVSCQGSVPQAIEAFLEGDGLESAVRKAVSIGGDSDTIAAIAASIAQGRFGLDAAADLVADVRDRLPGDLLAINDRFWDFVQSREQGTLSLS